jgi:tripartite-type tricarboxylate transporter receptor subunit TctC
MKARAAALGYRLVGGTPEQLGAFLRADIDKWANVAKKGGLAVP